MCIHTQHNTSIHTQHEHLQCASTHSTSIHTQHEHPHTARASTHSTSIHTHNTSIHTHSTCIHPVQEAAASKGAVYTSCRSALPTHAHAPSCARSSPPCNLLAWLRAAAAADWVEWRTRVKLHWSVSTVIIFVCSWWGIVGAVCMCVCVCLCAPVGVCVCLCAPVGVCVSG